MANNFSNYMANTLINATLRNTNYTSPVKVYMALFTSDPTKAGTGTEVSGNGYARTEIQFAPPTNGTTSNSNTVTFPAATASWGTIGYFALFDAQTNGNMLYFGALTSSVTIGTGNTFVAQPGAITLTLS